MRKIDIHSARRYIFFTWIVLFVPIASIITLQTINRKFDWPIGWGWLAPMTIPIISMMLPLLHLNERKINNKTAPLSIFSACIILMSLYFFSLYLIVLYEPFSDISIEDLFVISPWFLTPVQGILIGLISKLFLE